MSRNTLRPPLTPLVAAIAASALAVLVGLGDAAPASGAVKRLTFGHSVRGRKLRAVRLGDPNATRKALVVGSIHGDEREGHEIVRRLRRSHRDTRGVQLWVVKTVNPDGVDSGSRKNARGVDLNRNFSYRWRGNAPAVERLLPGPPSVLRAREPRRQAPREAAQAPGDDLVPPAVGTGAPALPRPRPFAQAVRAHRPPAGQTLSRPEASWHGHELAEPPPPGHRVRGRAAGRRAAELGGPAPRPRGGEGGAERGAGGGSCGPAAPRAGRSRRRGAARARLRRPPIDRDRIPYGQERKRQMAGYSARHYGRRKWRLRHPRAIVLHFTAGPATGPHGRRSPPIPPTWVSCPGSAHTSWSQRAGASTGWSGPRIRCRHTIGLNHRSIGVEMVQRAGRGSHWADRQILHRRGRYVRRCASSAGSSSASGSRCGTSSATRWPTTARTSRTSQGWRNDHTDWLRRDVRKFHHRLRRLLGGGVEAAYSGRCPRR